MSELEHLYRDYHAELNRQKFIESDLDYTVFEKHRPFLERLAQVNKSGVTVFDLFKKQHIFTSYNFTELFGHDMMAIQEYGNEYFNSRVHPHDMIALLQHAIIILRFYYQLEQCERLNYKFITEYRILGGDNKYIRVIEQHQALETDRHGNVWLALGIIDISPDQSALSGIKTQLFNYKTGRAVAVGTNNDLERKLSKRELEVLQYVKDGLLSKEISEKLFISVHTVNTHRQRILEKLGVSNSIEAISYAARFGLLK